MTPVQGFFIELINRLRTKSPRFFALLQMFGASLTLAGYLPSILQRWFNAEVPGHVITLCEDVAQYATGFFLATLMAKKDTIATAPDGTIVTVTDEKKFPLSAKAEKKEVDK
jgi:hypothetical protein